jgi:hypothetical protein
MNSFTVHLGNRQSVASIALAILLAMQLSGVFGPGFVGPVAYGQSPRFSPKDIRRERVATKVGRFNRIRKRTRDFHRTIRGSLHCQLQVRT